MPERQVPIRIGLPASFRGAVAAGSASGDSLPVGDGGFLKFLFGGEVSVEGTVGKPGGLHDFAYGDILEPAFPKEAGSLLNDPFMFCGGFFDRVAYFFCNSYI